MLEPTKIKLMAEYAGTIVWRDGGGRNDVGHIELSELPLSSALKQRLTAWARYFDSILNQDDPANSRFRNEGKELQFDRIGFKLWRRMRQELGPKYAVRYFCQCQGRLHSE